MSAEDPNVTVARFNFKQAIIVAGITGATTLGGTLLTLKSRTSDPGKDTTSVIQADCKQEKEQLEEVVANSIAFSSLADISDTYFGDADGKEQIKSNIRDLVGSAEQYQTDKQHFTYKLFQLKKLMLINGGNINVRISRASPEACALIQDLLKGIEFYRGSVDGNVESTRQAVEYFQTTLNQYTPGYFEEQNLGIFGKKTFNAILERYESSGG